MNDFFSHSNSAGRQKHFAIVYKQANEQCRFTKLYHYIKIMNKITEKQKLTEFN